MLSNESLEYSSEFTEDFTPCACCWCTAFKPGDTHCHFCMSEDDAYRFEIYGVDKEITE